jgi:lysophospholipase L1-like esterase
MKEKNICVFGDSITWGAVDKEYGGWFNRLWIYNENREGEESTYFYNLGIPGDTTKELVGRIDTECKFRTPTSIIIAIGINDTAFDKNNNPSTPINDFISNMNNIINLSMKYTHDIILIGLTRVNEELVNDKYNDIEYNYYNNMIIKYDTIIRQISKERDLKYIYLYDKLLDSDISEDGIHPNSIGHNKIFNEIKQAIYR